MTLDLTPLSISLKTAICTTVITFFLGLIAARLMLDRRGKAKSIIDTLFIAPLVLPPTVVGFLLLLLLGKNSWIGQALQAMGINLIFTWQATVISAIVVSFPLMYRTSLGAFEQIEHNIILAARTLGSSEWRIFWTIMVPLAYRGIVAGIILSFARALGEFGATLMLAGNIPGKTQTMPLAIFFATESGDYQTAFIWVLVLLFISLSVIIVVNFWTEKKQSKNQSIPTKKNYSLLGLNLLRNIFDLKLSDLKRSESISNFDGLFLDIEKKHADFSLAVTLESGQQALGFLGASGSGKSMTLRCIAGLETPDRGLITVNGRVWFDSRRRINLPPCQRRVGFVFQNYALFPHLTVRENIAFGVRNLPSAEQKRRVDIKISQMHLQDLENRYPAHLSGGQQQRVAIARALVIEPEILLLDEPFSALDTQLRSQMEKNLLETLSLYPGITLMVSHNLEEIYRVCQDLLVISDGKVLRHGDKQEIFKHPNLYEVARLTGCKNFSAIEVISPRQVRALNWNCTLTLSEPFPATANHICIRAHHLLFAEVESLKSQPRLRKNILFNENYSLEAEAQFPETLPSYLAHVEISSHNTFPCWLVQKSETPFKMTLYLKLNNPPEHFQDYHLQVELFKENWQLLQNFPFPWHCRLDPERLFLVDFT
ncbi:molybdate ABC transporter permease subunit [Synechocystis sp. LKSZ1]|uniref:molybdate ABC transporter permease subunit n=1 Tax=Synechocystis sp. LKSZ1 TaxID=3144951 RepID=UPI00336BFC49